MKGRGKEKRRQEQEREEGNEIMMSNGEKTSNRETNGRNREQR